MGEWLLSRRDRLTVARHEVPWVCSLDICRKSRREVSAPKGLEDSAQGFNPGNRRPERFALKGRQTKVLTTRE